MQIFIYLFLIIINGVFAFNKKQDKLLQFGSIAFLTIIMLGSYSAPDYLSYLNDYTLMIETGTSSFKDVGFVFIENFFVNLNFNYSFFRLSIIIVSIILIYRGLKDYKINFHYIISLYMTYQFFMDTMQLRNFLAVSIFIYGLQYILNMEKKNKFKYLIFVLIASSVHSSIIIYSIFIIFEFLLSKKKILKIALTISTICSIVIYFFPSIINNFSFLFKIINKEDIFLRYFSNVGKSLGFILPLLSFLICCCLYQLFFKDKLQLMSKQIWGLNVISMFFFPLIVIDPTWYRVIRNLNILNYSGFWLLYNQEDTFKMKLISYFIPYFIVIIWFIIECLIWIGPEKILPIFQLNDFWL